MTIVHGTLETPEFQRRSRDFAAGLPAALTGAELLVAEGYSHFDVLETLGNSYGWMGRAALALMKPGPA